MESKRLSDKAENTTSDRTGKDITDEVTDSDEKVELYKIEELAPSSVPITIPYMEVMRTNELEYVPYISPYNVGVSSSSSDSLSSESLSDTGATDSSTTGNDNSTDSNGSATGTDTSNSSTTSSSSSSTP